MIAALLSAIEFLGLLIGVGILVFVLFMLARLFIQIALSDIEFERLKKREAAKAAAEREEEVA